MTFHPSFSSSLSLTLSSLSLSATPQHSVMFYLFLFTIPLGSNIKNNDCSSYSWIASDSKWLLLADSLMSPRLVTRRLVGLSPSERPSPSHAPSPLLMSPIDPLSQFIYTYLRLTLRKLVDNAYFMI